MSDKEIAEKSLENITYKLITSPNHIFYGLFISELNKTFDLSIPTACIGKHPNAKVPTMTFNYEFWNNELKTDEEKAFVLIHEVCHYIDEAWEFGKIFNLEDKFLLNIAQDIVINEMLKKDPEFKIAKQKFVNAQGVIEEVDICITLDSFKELKLKADENSLYYYLELKKAKDKKQSEKGQKDSLAGPEGNKKGSTGSKALDGLLDREEEIGDWHIKWEELKKANNDIEMEIISRQIIDGLKRIAEETEKLKGNIPVQFKEKIEKNFEKIKQTVSWKSVFRKFIGSTVDTNVINTRKRPNRRYEDAPTYKFKQKIKGIVGCDSSGSMSDNDMSQINSEMYHIFKAGALIDYTSWDADVDPHKKYDGKLLFERTKAGGTRISCMIDYINKHYSRNNWKFAVIGTDGYVENQISRCKIPLIIVVTKSGTTKINTKHKIVQINE